MSNEHQATAVTGSGDSRALVYGGDTEEKVKATEFKRSLAVIIGINDYHSGIPPLRTAINDAQRLAHVLERDHRYEVTLLVEEVTLEKLRVLLTETLPHQVSKDDRLLFYFAGHGIALDGDDGPAGYLIPQDANATERSTLLEMTELHEALTKLPCRHMLIILDCCFAGAMRWSTMRAINWPPEIIHKERYERFIRDRAWQLLTSAAYDQKALDLLNGETIGRRGDASNRPHSPFAQALFEALAGAGDRGGDGVITATELYLYLRDYVEPKAEEQLGHWQTPGLWPLKEHGKGEYIFLTPGRELNLPPAPELTFANNPYRGLQSFEEEHQDLFFGRSGVVAKLAEVVVNQPLTVVLGASGTGKSSLVKAGLVPYVKDKDQRVSGVEGAADALPPLRPGESPMRALETLLRDHLPDAGAQSRPQTGDPNALTELISQWVRTHPHQKLMLIIDQSEELITLCRDESERWRFVQWLWHTLQRHPDTFRLVLTLRSDFEPQLVSLFKQAGELETVTFSQSEQFSATKLAGQTQALDSDLARSVPSSPALTPEHLTWNRFIIPPMSQAELREAIEGPASARVLYFEPPSLVDRLIDEVIQTPGALPLLSFTLSEMYIKYLERQGDNRALTEKDYEALGGVIGSLSKRATEEYNKLPDQAHQETMRRLMLRMIAIEGGELARRRVPRSELVYPGEAENLRVETVLQRLLTARLIVRGKSEGEGYVEPAHDALVQAWNQLLMWKIEAEEYLPLQRNLTQAANDWYNTPATRNKQGMLWHNNPKLPQLQEILEDANLQNEQYTSFWQRNWRTIFPSARIFQGITWLNYREAEFVRQSIYRRTRDLRLLIEVIAITMAILASAAIFANNQRLVADERRFAAVTAEAQAINAAATAVAERNTAISRQLAMQSMSQLNPPYDLALLLAIEAGRASDTAEAFGALRQVLAKPGRTLKISSDIYSELFSKSIVAWKPGGYRSLVVTDSRGHIKDIPSYTKLPILENYKYEIKAWNVDDKVLTADEDGTVRVWDATTGKELLKLIGHQKGINQADWNADESRILTASQDGTARVWDATTGKEILNLSGHISNSWDASWNFDGSRILTSGASDGIRVWDTNTGKRLLDIPILVEYPEAYQAIWSPDGSRILVNDSHTTQVFDVSTGNKLLDFSGHQRGIADVTWNSDGTRILTSGCDISGSRTFSCKEGTAQIWNAESGEKLLTFYGHGDWVDRAMWNADETRILTGSSWEPPDRIWAIEAEPELPTILGHGYSFNQAQWDARGERILTAGDDGVARVWNVNTAQELLNLVGHQKAVNQVTWSRDESQILTASDDGTARVWDATTGKELRQILHSQKDSSLAYDNLDKELEAVIQTGWNPNHTYIFTLSERSVSVWDTETGKLLSTLESQFRFEMAAWAADGTHLLIADSDHAAIWDIETGEEIYLPDVTYYVTWNNTSKSVLAAGCKRDLVDSTATIFCEKGQVLVFDATTEDLFLTFTSQGTVINQANWNNGESQILAVGNEGSVYIWDTKTGEILFTLVGHGNSIKQSSWNKDERRILVNDGDSVRQYYTHMEDLVTATCHQAPRNLTQEEWRRFLGNQPYRKTCPNLPIDPELVIEMSQELIQSGEINEAVSQLQQILERNPSPDLVPNVEAQHLIAPLLIREGRRLADEGNTKEALTNFQEALTLDPTLNLDPEAEVYRLTAQYLIRQGRALATEGDIEGAVAKFKEAIKLDSTLNLDPKAEVMRLAGSKLIDQGVVLLRRGYFNGALVIYKDILTLDSNLEIVITARSNLCLYGVYWGFGAQVIHFCEQGVASASADQLGRMRSRRGVARALIGNYEGAVEDLKAYVEWLKLKDSYHSNSEIGPRFEAFIAKLETGQNPFDEPTLKELRQIIFGE